MTESIRNTTGRIIRQLYGNDSPDKAVLASLRGATSLDSPRAIAAWPTLLGLIDQKYLSYDGKPTYAEIAIFTAVHLYAMHQQGQDHLVYGSTQGTSEQKGLSVFTALARLRADPDNRTAIDRRVYQLLAMTNLEAVVNSLTSLVGIIKSSKLNEKIDYALLAENLFGFQLSYERANQVRLRWGEEYYGSDSTERKDNNDKQ